MTQRVFQLHKNIDGTHTLWYPWGTELVKVVRYSERPNQVLIERDTEIFFRGMNAR